MVFRTGPEHSLRKALSEQRRRPDRTPLPWQAALERAVENCSRTSSGCPTAGRRSYVISRPAIDPAADGPRASSFGVAGAGLAIHPARMAFSKVCHATPILCATSARLGPAASSCSAQRAFSSVIAARPPAARSSEEALRPLPAQPVDGALQGRAAHSRAGLEAASRHTVLVQLGTLQEQHRTIRQRWGRQREFSEAVPKFERPLGGVA